MVVAYRQRLPALFLWVSQLTRSLVAADGPVPIEAVWSDKHLGPDGPWPALEIRVGESPDPIAIYPGGGLSPAILLTRTYCDNIGPDCYAEDAGLYDPGPIDKEALPESLTNNPFFTWAYDDDSDTPWRFLSENIEVTPGRVATNVTVGMIDEGQIIYPGGQKCPYFAGCLGLGLVPGWIDELFPKTGDHYITDSLNEFQDTPSNSWSLHMGSVTTGPPPSLIFGGYDAARAYGTVFGALGGAGPVNLSQISIDVIDGHSPFQFNVTSGPLLNDQGPPLLVGIDPCAPYITLPRAACEAMKTYLPIDYAPKLGVYLWDTESPYYNNIVRSASALSFTFASADGINVTISVPFQHLNLTLEPPLSETKIPYFPCNGAANGNFVLGRAFLQDAFISEDYGHDNGNGFGYFYMAQAPGPNTLDKNILPITKARFGIAGGRASDWKDTWEGHWTPLPADQARNYTGTDSNSNGNNDNNSSNKPSHPGSNTDGESDSNSSSLTSGAIAGIAVGAVVGVLAIAGLIFWRCVKSAQGPVTFCGLTILSGKSSGVEPRYDSVAHGSPGKPILMQPTDSNHSYGAHGAESPKPMFLAHTEQYYGTYATTNHGADTPPMANSDYGRTNSDFATVSELPGTSTCYELGPPELRP
ncbi:hypothetical protein GGS20DRAFT_556334 [Poronia punctata]|nr:hypothetical protein GGS20DRAFT_556334 [Poronia punctata]